MSVKKYWMSDIVVHNKVK